MNEEEKQAVKDFEDLLKKHFEETSVTSFNFLDGVEGIHILNIIKKQQKEIEDIKKIGFYNKGFDKGVEFVENRIKEKLEEIRKEYNNLFTQNLSLNTMNINSHRYDAMSQVLRELLKGNKTNE